MHALRPWRARASGVLLHGTGTATADELTRVNNHRPSIFLASPSRSTWLLAVQAASQSLDSRTRRSNGIRNTPMISNCPSSIPYRDILRFVRRGKRHKLVGWLQPAGNILEERAQRALLTGGRGVARGFRASCGIIRIAVADIISCRGSSADNRDFAVFSPERDCVADSLSYHWRRIAIHRIVHADCRVKGCVKLFQFSHLGQLFVIVPPVICMRGS